MATAQDDDRVSGCNLRSATSVTTLADAASEGAAVMGGVAEARQGGSSPNPPANPASGQPLGQSSKWRGVTWNKKCGKWQSVINHAGRHVHLGTFADEVEAAVAFDKAAVMCRGAAAKVNFSLSRYMDVADGTVYVDSEVQKRLTNALQSPIVRRPRKREAPQQAAHVPDHQPPRKRVQASPSPQPHADASPARHHQPSPPPQYRHTPQPPVELPSTMLAAAAPLPSRQVNIPSPMTPFQPVNLRATAATMPSPGPFTWPSQQVMHVMPAPIAVTPFFPAQLEAVIQAALPPGCALQALMPTESDMGVAGVVFGTSSSTTGAGLWHQGRLHAVRRFSQPEAASDHCEALVEVAQVLLRSGFGASSCSGLHSMSTPQSMSAVRMKAASGLVDVPPESLDSATFQLAHPMQFVYHPHVSAPAAAQHTPPLPSPKPAEGMQQVSVPPLSDSSPQAAASGSTPSTATIPVMNGGGRVITSMSGALSLGRSGSLHTSQLLGTLTSTGTDLATMLQFPLPFNLSSAPGSAQLTQPLVMLLNAGPTAGSSTAEAAAAGSMMLLANGGSSQKVDMEDHELGAGGVEPASVPQPRASVQVAV